SAAFGKIGDGYRSRKARIQSSKGLQLQTADPACFSKVRSSSFRQSENFCSNTRHLHRYPVESIPSPHRALAPRAEKADRKSHFAENQNFSLCVEQLQILHVSTMYQRVSARGLDTDSPVDIQWAAITPDPADPARRSYVEHRFETVLVS